MALSFPNSPSNGQTYTSGSDTYVFDGKRWGKQVNAQSNVTLTDLGASNHDLLAVNASGDLTVDGKHIVTDGVGSIVTGHWDTVNNRIEGTGKPMFITNYGDDIMIGKDGTPGWTVGNNTNYINGEKTLYSGTTNVNTVATDMYQNATGLISTGTYLLKVWMNVSPWYSETWTGIMQWYSSGTNSNDATNIYMTGMGHAPNGRVLYARVKRYGGNTGLQSLQLWTNSASTNTNMTISVRRIG